MRKALAFCFVAAFATAASAKDIYLTVGGSVGVFRTDMRIFNPWATKDIVIQAYLLPSGNGDNSGVQPQPVTVAKRSMVVYDDVVGTLFHSSGLAAIRLKSDDDFVATQRIYAAAQNGTLGQFVPGLDVSQAKKQGVLIQVKSGPLFRTNVGAVNPSTSLATVTWRLYDKNNALVGTEKVERMPPGGVISPQNITGYLNSGNADLTDAWISYVSDQPIFAYVSVVDNGTTDPTFIPMSEDTGVVAASPQPPTVTGKVFNVSLRAGSITVTPQINALPGETVTFRITASEPNHGFQMIDPEGSDVIAPVGILTQNQTIERQVQFNLQGTYQYFCTNATCSTVAGHSAMYGKFDVGKATPEERPTY